MEILNSLFGNGLPEVKTDVGSDLDTVIKNNAKSLGIGLFVVIVLAILIANYLTKKIG